MADGRPPEGEQLLVGLVGIVAEAATRVLDAPPELAKVLGDEIATRFSDEFGGTQQYVPKGRVFRTSTLHRQIWERFTGKPEDVKQLAREFGISTIYVYRILARERERDRAERQSQLQFREGA